MFTAAILKPSPCNASSDSKVEGSHKETVPAKQVVAPKRAALAGANARLQGANQKLSTIRTKVAELRARVADLEEKLMKVNYSRYNKLR